jgi:hypothetical protein
MSLTLTGTVQKSGMGTGTWSFVADSGQTYELYKDAPADLLKDGLKIQVEGKVREDIMTIAMIGPVLEVTSFQLLS